MTGWTATLDVRIKPTDASPIISISTTATTSGSITFTNPSGATYAPLNQYNLWITALAMSGSSVTAGLKANYDLIMFSLAGQEIKVMSGYFLVGTTQTH